jgi:hypothetical protein
LVSKTDSLGSNPSGATTNTYCVLSEKRLMEPMP